MTPTLAIDKFIDKTAELEEGQTGSTSINMQFVAGELVGAEHGWTEGNASHTQEAPQLDSQSALDWLFETTALFTVDKLFGEITIDCRFIEGKLVEVGKKIRRTFPKSRGQK